MPRRSHGSVRRDRDEAETRRRTGGSRAGDDQQAPRGQQTQPTPNGDYLVRRVTGAASAKSYRCPGCRQLIPPGQPHLVAWPAEDLSWTSSAVDERRHWHSSCWHRWSTRGGPRPG